MSRLAGSNQNGATIAAAKPSRVAGATSGSASTFAGIAERLTLPDSAATIGAVTRWAAAATASDFGDAQRNPPPPQRLSPRRRDRQQRGRGEHRHRETRVKCESRVVEQQHHDGEPDRGKCCLGPSRGQPDQRDEAHRGGTQHTRRRASDEHKGDQQQHSDQRAHPRSRPHFSGAARARPRRAGSSSSYPRRRPDA